MRWQRFIVIGGGPDDLAHTVLSVVIVALFVLVLGSVLVGAPFRGKTM